MNCLGPANMHLTQEGSRKVHACLTRLALRHLDRYGVCFDRLDYGLMVENTGALFIKGRLMLGGEVIHFQGTYPEILAFLNDYLDGRIKESYAKYEAGLL